MGPRGTARLMPPSTGSPPNDLTRSPVTITADASFDGLTAMCIPPLPRLRRRPQLPGGVAAQTGGAGVCPRHPERMRRTVSSRLHATIVTPTDVVLAVAVHPSLRPTDA